MLPLQGAWVRSLVGELRARMPRGTAEKKEKNTQSSSPANYFSTSHGIPGVEEMRLQFSMVRTGEPRDPPVRPVPIGKAVLLIY